MRWKKDEQELLVKFTKYSFDDDPKAINNWVETLKPQEVEVLVIGLSKWFRKILQSS